MDYSKALPFALGEEGRLEKGQQIVSIIEDFYRKKDLKKMALLDYGSSTGIATNFFADKFKRVVGVDIDANATKIARKRYKKKNLSFYKINSERTDLKSNHFDVVINNQVYNCVDDAKIMFDEIHRVLKPGGVCFLGARNKLVLIESQYKLPLLTLMPLFLAKKIIKFTGKGDDFGGRKYQTYWGLRKSVKKFKLHDYTLKVLRNSKKFGFNKYNMYSGIARRLPLERFIFLIPNYLWILEKRK